MANKCNKCGGLFLGTEDHSLACPARTVVEYGAVGLAAEVTETEHIQIHVAAANDAMREGNLETAMDLVIAAGVAAVQRRMRLGDPTVQSPARNKMEAIA